MLTKEVAFDRITYGNCKKAMIMKYFHDAAVAQSVERRIGSAEVTGPIPVSSFHVGF